MECFHGVCRSEAYDFACPTAAPLLTLISGGHVRVGAGCRQANYDTSHQTNSLIPWIAKGMNMDPLPPLPPPPPPDPHVPFYLGGYIYPTRASVRGIILSSFLYELP